VNLVDFIIRIYQDARSCECQTHNVYQYTTCIVSSYIGFELISHNQANLKRYIQYIYIYMCVCVCVNSLKEYKYKISFLIFQTKSQLLQITLTV
jgi:hypothetical protein